MAEKFLVKKSNRIVSVGKNDVKSYLNRGYDQINEDGEIVKRATGGKNVSVAEHNKALDRIAELEEKLENGDSKDGVSQEEFDKLQEAYQELGQERDELEEKAKNFAEKGKQLQEENNKLKSQLNKKNK